MMNTILIHLENEQLATIDTTLNKDESILNLGDELTVFINQKQFNLLFNELDEQMHNEFERHEYMKERIEQLENMISEKDDLIFDLQSDLDDANEKIEMFEDNINDKL